MNNTQIARAFVMGATYGKASNMFIDGQTIYSYGYHFPIARLIGARYAVLNSNGYSVTTARHKSHVLSALMDAGKIIIEAPGCALEKSPDYLEAQAKKARDKAMRARSDKMVNHWAYVADKYEEQLQHLDNLTK